jgi:ion channel-forming bestrophin family protein
MITYNPKDWFTFIFRIHRYETFRQLIPLMIGLSVYAGLITYFEFDLFFSADSKELTRSISTIFSILGFTLSLMLVFRTNSAYDRWWEGRKQWGDLTNASRAFAAHLNGVLDESAIEERRKITALMSTFAYALRFHLKGEKMQRATLTNELDEQHLVHFIDMSEQAAHQPMVIYKELVAFIYSLKTTGMITDQDMYVIKSDLNRMIEVCGACERIRSTPIPFSYSAFLKKFIFFYVMLFPLIYAMHMSYFIIPVTVFILYVLSSIELIAEEIENPFDDAPNDLPTFKMAKNIAVNVKMILDK